MMKPGHLYLKQDPNNPERNASMGGMRPEYLGGIPTIVRCFAHYGSPCVLTSGTDGEHMDGSLHYEGLAGDYRIWYVAAEELEALVADLRWTLGYGWDVVLEGTHIHIERDLKK
jgi:hypothetical protein